MPKNIEKLVSYDNEGNRIKKDCTCDCSEKSSLGKNYGNNYTENKVDIEIIERAYIEYRDSLNPPSQQKDD